MENYGNLWKLMETWSYGLINGLRMEKNDDLYGHLVSYGGFFLPGLPEGLPDNSLCSYGLLNGLIMEKIDEN